MSSGKPTILFPIWFIYEYSRNYFKLKCPTEHSIRMRGSRTGGGLCKIQEATFRVRFLANELLFFGLHTALGSRLGIIFATTGLVRED
jgi:hypothetical protein